MLLFSLAAIPSVPVSYTHLKPLANDKVIIMTATLITVATVLSRIINLEKDFFSPGILEDVKAILFAMKPATFKLFFLSFIKNKALKKKSLFFSGF